MIPGLEGSTHVNLRLTSQFMTSYLSRAGADLSQPKSLAVAGTLPGENPYLMNARTSGINTIIFPHFLKAYAPLMSIANIRLFVQQAKAFQLFVRKNHLMQAAQTQTDLHLTMMIGRCLATIAYAQLVVENAVLLDVPAPVVSVIFHLLVSDLNVSALGLLAWSVERYGEGDVALRRLIAVPSTSQGDWEVVSARASNAAKGGHESGAGPFTRPAPAMADPSGPASGSATRRQRGTSC
jgi:hypothetical protein